MEFKNAAENSTEKYFPVPNFDSDVRENFASLVPIITIGNRTKLIKDQLYFTISNVSESRDFAVPKDFHQTPAENVREKLSKILNTINKNIFGDLKNNSTKFLFRSNNYTLNDTPLYDKEQPINISTNYFGLISILFKTHSSDWLPSKANEQLISNSNVDTIYQDLQNNSVSSLNSNISTGETLPQVELQLEESDVQKQSELRSIPGLNVYVISGGCLGECPDAN